MSRPEEFDRTCLPRTLAALLIGLSPTVAGAAGPEPTQSVTVRVDQFTYEMWSSRDVDTLALTMRAARPNWVELVACGPDAGWSLQAMAQRLNDLPLQLKALPASAPACAGTAPSEGVAEGFAASSADRVAVAHYWQQVMP
jgi:hypothetical protein